MVKRDIRNTTLLDFGESNLVRDGRVFNLAYVPEKFYIRKEMRTVANYITTFLKYSSPEHIYLSGKPGSGKTASIKYIQREVEENKIKLDFHYISGRECNTRYKVMARICGYNRNVNPNKVYDEFYRRITDKTIVVLDEADTLEPKDLNDICFMFSRWGEAAEVPENSYVLLILVGCKAYPHLLRSLEPAVLSSLSAHNVFYGTYQKEELFEILRLRAEEGLYDGVWNDGLLEEIASACVKEYLGDTRHAILALKELAAYSERKRSSRIEGDIEKALEKAAERVVVNTLSGLGTHELLVLYSACRVQEDDRQTGALRAVYEKACSHVELSPVKKSKFYEIINSLQRLSIITASESAKSTRQISIAPAIDEEIVTKYVENMFHVLRTAKLG